MAEDEDHVSMVLEAMEGREVDHSPVFAEYDSPTQRLDRLAELMQVLINVTVAAHGGKPGKIVPQPRPKTAFEKVQHRRRSVRHQMTVNRVLGRQADG